MSEPKGTGIPCQVTIVKAQKQYQCRWCGEEIKKGEKHCRCTGHWEGDWQDWRMHSECYERNAEYISEGFDPFENERA